MVPVALAFISVLAVVRAWQIFRVVVDS